MGLEDELQEMLMNEGSSQGDGHDDTTANEMETNPEEETEQITESTATTSASVEEVEEGSTEETTEEAPVSDEEPDRESALLARIEELQEQLLERTTIPDASDEESGVEPETTTELNFLDTEDIDEVLGDPVQLNKVLVKVHQHALEEASKRAAENVMRNLPKVITTYIGQHTTMQEMVNDFYRENPDLQAVKRTVAAVANEINAENPGMNMKELFDKAATKTREVLKIKKNAEKKANTGKKPAFAKQGARPAPEKGLSGIAAEIEELVDL